MNDFKHGNVIHIPKDCDNCWFYHTYYAEYSSKGDSFNQWCGLLAKHIDFKECNCEKVIIKKGEQHGKEKE